MFGSDRVAAATRYKLLPPPRVIGFRRLEREMTHYIAALVAPLFVKLRESPDGLEKLGGKSEILFSAAVVG